MRTFIQDLRFAFRILSGSPGFAAVAALTLALGIASTATVFSWIDALLVHPFPGASRPDELNVLEAHIPSAPNGGSSLSWLDYTDFRDKLKLVDGVLLERGAAFALGDPDAARLTWGELVSANYFEVLGIQPLLGHLLVRGENGDTPGAYPAAVISERLWRSYFRKDPKIVGKSVRVNRRQLTIVGVTPGEFRGTVPALAYDLWVPASMGAELGIFESTVYSDRDYRDFNSAIARLKPGVSLERARAEIVALARNISAAYPKTNRIVSATLNRPWYAHNGAGELLLSPLRILMAVSVLLLLIVCANVANLLLARSVARRREFGVRLALGSSRWRLARQLMTETFVLAAAGAVPGVLLLFWMAGSLVSLLPDIGLPVITDVSLNGRILAFVAMSCLVATLAAGAAPAMLSLPSGVNEALKEGGRGGSSGTASHRTRSLLVVAEVALAAIALVGAGLFARSFQNARAIHPGFDSGHVLFGRFFIESTGYTPAEEKQFASRLRQNLEAAPGMEKVSYSDFVPLSATAGPYEYLRAEGYTPAPGEPTSVNRALVPPGYFDTLRIPILEGRDFDSQDDPKSRPVMIVNQAFARRYFQGRNPVARRVWMFDRWFTVVGLARDSKYFNGAEPPRPFFYLAFDQFFSGVRELDVFVRTTGDPTRAIPTLRHVVAATDPNATAFHALPLAEYTEVSLFPQKVAASLMGTLGLMCLLLAAMGLYSVMSYAVTQRSQEIGIRMAMGAQPANVVGMVLRDGMRLTAVGLAIGMAAALAVTRLVAGMLVHVDAADPLTFAGAALFLALVALAATWLPAHRATRIDPMLALRQ